MGKKPILLIDFDGVIHMYTSGWKGADVVSDGPVPGAIDFLKGCIPHFTVCIYSARSAQPGGVGAMQFAIGSWGGPDLVEALEFPTEKPPAFWTIDDRCTQFTGTFPQPADILNFKTWTSKPV